MDIYFQLWSEKYDQVISFIDSQPKTVENLCTLSLALALKNRTLDSEKILKEIDLHKLKPTARNIYFDSKLVLLIKTEKDLSALETFAQEILNSNPKSIVALYYLGRINEKKKQYDLALEYFEQIKSIFPTSDKAKYWCAREYFWQKKYSSAILEIKDTKKTLQKMLNLVSCYSHMHLHIFSLIFIAFLLFSGLIPIYYSILLLLVFIICLLSARNKFDYISSIYFLDLFIIELMVIIIVVLLRLITKSL